MSRAYLPPPAFLKRRRGWSALRDRFDAWLCGLPIDAARGALWENVVTQTLGKATLARVRGLHLSSTVQIRHILAARGNRSARLALGRWAPGPGCASSVDADVCDSSPKQQHQDGLRSFVDLLGMHGELPAQGATAASLWWAGQLARLALRSIGACGAPLPIRTMRAISSTEPRQGSGTIGMHVRRGDACNRFARDGEAWRAGAAARSKAQAVTGPMVSGLRPCFSVRSYMRAAEALRERYGARRIVLATDSNAVVTEMGRQSSRAGFDLDFVIYDRQGVGGAENATVGLRPKQAEALFIEKRSGVDVKLTYESFRAELALLAEADSFVGTAVSIISVLALLCIIGSTGQLRPYILLDQPLGAVFSRVARPRGSGGHFVKVQQSNGTLLLLSGSGVPIRRVGRKIPRSGPGR